MTSLLRGASASAFYSTILICALHIAPATAQELRPDIVVTATRNPDLVSRAGSAISVISSEDIRKSNPQSVADLFRQVPGVTMTQDGGPGQTQSMRIRGMEGRHTLVLVDGVRMNDTSSPAGDMNFANLVLTDIERIEVLRGPQSALYGSDAIGGVVNIITKKGKGAPKLTLDVGGGSFGTRWVRGSVSGGAGPLSYAFSASHMMTSGFSSYGYRIGRLEALRGGKFEADSASRNGLAGRIGYKLTDTLELEIGGNLNSNRYQYDTAFGKFPDGPSTGEGLVLNGFAKISHSLFDGRFKHSLTAFGSSTEREFKSRSVFDFSGPPALSGTNYSYRGERQGAEYQGTFAWGAPGTTVFGARFEQERFIGKSQNVIPRLGFGRIDDKADQSTRSLFAMHQITLAQRLHLSLGGRIDDVSRIDPFRTVRATLAYELPESDTKLRTSIGTGAKAPSLYQLYSTQYGTRTLEPETSLGIDAGIDQSLFDGRVKASVTAFSNRYRNLIDYSSAKGCSPVQIANFTGCYINIARARTAGLETSADIIIVPDMLRLKLAYTNLRATDATTNLPLARRPENEGRIALAISPITGLTIEPVVTFVGQRWSSQGKTQQLQPYGKLDLLVDYKLNDNLTLYARGENLTDARYQEVKDYGTAGRSGYLGIRTTW